MKIVHLTRNFYPLTGGIETYVYEASKRLVKSGHEVFVITSNSHPMTNRRFKEREVIDGIKVFRVPFQRIFRYNISLESIKLLESLRPNIVHIHGLGLLSDMAPFIKIFNGSKVVVSTHGGIFHTKYASFMKKIYFNTLSRFTLSFADKIIAHSIHDEKIFSKISEKDKIIISHYGIDWKKLSKTKRNSDGKTLLYMGRLAKNKRIDKMLNVLFYVKKRIPDIKLLLVGEDWGVKPSLMPLIENLGISKNVCFIGPVEHEKISKYLSKSDVFLLASEYEGFGISVLEAMATGLPVVANNIDAMKEIVKNGYNGFVTDFDNYKKTAEIVLKVLKSKPTSKRIKESVKKYDWSIICKGLEELYKAI